MNASQNSIFQQALQWGLQRAQAEVVAHLAYWEQMEGGREVKGHTMRWRTVREIGSAVGYSPRTVTRALQFLREAGFIESQVIWSPTDIGTRVNAFRLLAKGQDLLRQTHEIRSKRRGRKGRSGSGEGDAVADANPSIRRARNGHGGAIKYSEPIQEAYMELATLSMEGENLFHMLEAEELQEEDLKGWFGEFLNCGGYAGKRERLFWSGLQTAVEHLTGKQIEGWSPEIGKRVARYLDHFVGTRSQRFGALDAPAAAVWAMLNPERFASDVENATGRRPTGFGASSYQLGASGFVLANRLIEVSTRSKLEAIEGTQIDTFFEGGFR